jgi:pyruvate dehydrogenase E2 component (dihydrolipoamide acetyltransferase)
VVKLGDKVSEGSVVLVLEAAGAAAAPAAPVSEPKQAQPGVAGSPAAAESVAAAAPAPAAATGPVEVRVPDIGDFKDVAVIEILVKPGDAVKLEQSLDHGRIGQGVDGDSVQRRRASSSELKVKLGDTVNIGDLLAVLEGAAGAAAAAPAACAPASAPASAPAVACTGIAGGCLLCRPQPPRARRSACRMRRPRCASSRANWACRWKRSRAPVPRAASPRSDVQAFVTPAVMAGAQTKAQAAKAPAAAAAGRGLSSQG